MNLEEVLTGGILSNMFYRYISENLTREVIDITLLNEQISQIVQRENTLRSEIDTIIAEIEGA